MGMNKRQKENLQPNQKKHKQQIKIVPNSLMNKMMLINSKEIRA
jgi:hypothetical protein